MEALLNAVEVRALGTLIEKKITTFFIIIGRRSFNFGRE